MKWEIGKEYKVRDGGVAIIHSIREEQAHCLIGEMKSAVGDIWEPQSWNINGKVLIEEDYPYDIIYQDLATIYFFNYKKEHALVVRENKDYYLNSSYEYLGSKEIDLNDLEE